MRGRKPKPEALRQRRNRRPSNTDPDAPLGAQGCPGWLGEVARVEWRRLTSTATEWRVFTALDRGPLTAYCVAWERWCKAEAEVQRLGQLIKAPKTGAPMQNPYVSIANAAHDRLVKLAAELRLTPISRSRAPIAKIEPPPDVDEPLPETIPGLKVMDARALLRVVK